jgi:hypothetical protein
MIVFDGRMTIAAMRAGNQRLSFGKTGNANIEKTAKCQTDKKQKKQYQKFHKTKICPGKPEHIFMFIILILN